MVCLEGRKKADAGKREALRGGVMGWMRRWLRGLVLGVCVLSMTGCGTLLYPERRQATLQADPAGRRIDPAVAVLDAACLVFFIIPGIVAFAVDFATGAIYLPSGSSSSLKGENQDLLAEDRLHPDLATIEAFVLARTGIPVDMRDPRLEAFVLDRSTFF